MGTLDGERALVTGGASGIGRAVCERFAAAGAKVAVLDRDGDGAQAVAAAIDGVAHPVDVRDAEAVDAATEAAARQLGGLTILVTNAGTSGLSLLHETDPARFERLVQVNLLGTFHAMRAAIPHMLAAGRGAIVNNASAAATRPTYGELAYSSAKAGVVALTRGAAQEYGPTIRVNSVSPGVIRTPMSEPMFAMDGALDPAWEATPLGRAGTADEVADVILFLASDQSRYVTGQDLIVDGGMGLGQAGITTTLRNFVDSLRA
ncbi:MAG TPA: SDR family NAD(P)-dependent oxidoreductase [Acidimicrobiales bacterium]|jgi:NAD(P)-dependent dehydrogenase (short-subunit alcohol dehydrogenase family)